MEKKRLNFPAHARNSSGVFSGVSSFGFKARLGLTAGLVTAAAKVPVDVDGVDAVVVLAAGVIGGAVILGAGGSFATLMAEYILPLTWSYRYL